MPTWNAYKVFANGKRAKNPLMTFESDDSSHFYNSILLTLEPKMQKFDWIILNTESPQERKAEQKEEVNQKFEENKIKVLSKLAKNKFPKYMKKNTEGCLMLNENTDWKWAWCVAESATLNFLGKLSQNFNTSTEAEEWIRNMVGTQPTG